MNPATEEVIGEFPVGGAKEVEDACAAASSSFDRWRRTSRVIRGDYFHRLARLIEDRRESLTRAISLETGKSLNESLAEVNEALHMTQYVAGQGRMPCGEVIASEIADRDSYVVRKPKGVVAVVSPWNFPLAIGGFWCAAPALLEGNTVVFKPSEDTPMVGQMIAELYHDAGFRGEFNLVHGDGSTGELLVNHPAVKHILFTGSVAVGNFIKKACALQNKTCSCEMGSKSAVVVCGDADVDLAVSATVASAFKLTGQRCVSAGRVLVQRSMLRKFLPPLVEAVEGLKFGDPLSRPAPFAGPVINKIQLERVARYNEAARQDRTVEVFVKPTRPEGKGYFVTPMVYQTEWADKSFLKEEVFGPHLAVIPFDTVERAIDIYNDTAYGLSLGVLTDDYRTMRKFRDECDAGMMYFNLGTIGAESSLPFGGVKASGYGWGSATATFDSVVHKVAVTVNHSHTLNFPQGMNVKA